MPRKYLTALVMVIMLCFLVAGCGTDSKTLKPGYYKHLTLLANGDIIGVDPVDEAKAKQGQVFKVEFNDQKKLSKIEHLSGGKIANTSWKDTIEQSSNPFAVLTVEYQDGYIKYNFKNDQMNPTTGINGAFSIRYKIDGKGLRTMAYNYNKDGEQFANLQRFAQMSFTYDDTGKITKIGYLNAGGERIITTDGYYELRLLYPEKADKYSRPIEISNNGKDGELKNNKFGYAKAKYTYDKKEAIIEIRFFGTDDSLKEINDTYANPQLMAAGAIVKIKRDEASYPIEVNFYGKDEQLHGVKHANGVSTIKFKTDENGYLAEVSTFGPDGLPKSPEPFNKNVVTHKFKYDAYGNQIENAAYGADGNLTAMMPKGKAAIIKHKYNEKRQIFETSYWGTSEEPIEENGYHASQYEYNDDGKTIEVLYFNKSNQLRQNGYAKLKYFYSPDGKYLRSEYFDANDKPIRPIAFN